MSGHSLGASVALIAAADLAPSRRPAGLHLFGCPYTGNRAFCDLFADLEVVRYETWADAVTFVPPMTSFAQILASLRGRRRPSLYRHVGRRVRVPGFAHGMAGYRVALDHFLAQEREKAVGA